MDQFVRSTYEAYVSVFDTYPVRDDNLRQQVDNFKEEMRKLAESAADITAFTNAFMGGGLQARYSELVSKAAMAGTQEETGGSTVQSNSDSKNAIPTVSEFVEQYRHSYDEIKKVGYRKRAEKAYEEIFNVANRTNDIAEAQIILEKERLLWNIVTTDSLDIYETILQAMDPLNHQLTDPLAMLVDVYKSSGSEEELRYKLELYESKKSALIQPWNTKVFIAALFAYRFLQYDQARRIVWEWPGDNLVRTALLAMIGLRKAIRRLVELLQAQFGIAFDDLLADESMKIWLLSPANADAIGRIKTALHPQNYKAFREILMEEILSDRSLEDILLREPRAVVYYALDKTGDRFQAYALEKAARLNESLVYFRYIKDLDSASGSFVQNTQTTLPLK